MECSIYNVAQHYHTDLYISTAVCVVVYQMKNRYGKGWFREPYRHYLAAKGVSTRRYFVRDEDKGRTDLREVPGLARATAKGYSKEELIASPGTAQKLGVDLAALQRYMQSRGKQELPESLSVSEGDFGGEATPLAEPEIPVEPVPEPVASVAPVAPVEQQQEPIGGGIATPGVPERSPITL